MLKEIQLELREVDSVISRFNNYIYNLVSLSKLNVGGRIVPMFENIGVLR